ncbi:hypothetical protein FEM48_Zijuj06G0162700 [Ziziphus jujuba var. spinosa]|uniref:Uncharacterized protein n=1 Tax=Ziziphus jujuba var. spinosa TaxID=714518 RepID=A0A978VAB5_ZIZJJ|nr:hypothetical protein FEM48_Zijuj06G0162700 [Ziziphus jujuba var. spinosa]
MIEYKAGSRNSEADALSRRHETYCLPLLAAISAGRYEFLDELLKENLKCLGLKAGPVVYTLALLTGSKIHPTFHVSLLKPFKGDIHVESYPLPEVLVQWSHSSLEAATWKDLQTFSQLYNVPDLEKRIVLLLVYVSVFLVWL